MVFAILINSIHFMYVSLYITVGHQHSKDVTNSEIQSLTATNHHQLEKSFRFYESGYWLPSGNELDGIIFSLDFHIFGLCWSFPKINFTGWISIEISMRLSDDLSQNILSDDQITHSSHKTRIRSFFSRHYSWISNVKFRLFMNQTTMWLCWSDPIDLSWPKNFK